MKIWKILSVAIAAVVAVVTPVITALLQRKSQSRAVRKAVKRNREALDKHNRQRRAIKEESLKREEDINGKSEENQESHHVDRVNDWNAGK